MDDCGQIVGWSTGVGARGDEHWTEELVIGAAQPADKDAFAAGTNACEEGHVAVQ